jgi:hypothetical protein
MAGARNFGDPHEFMDLPGTEGWREMYPYHMQMHSEEPTRTYESSKFWFIDTVHNPTPMMPLEAFAWDAMAGIRMLGHSVLRQPSAWIGVS